MLVFLCGAWSAPWPSTWAPTSACTAKPSGPRPGKDAAVARVKKELDLTPVQVEQMETILDDFAKYYTTVLSDGKSRIMQILNDDQKKKFERLLSEGAAGR